MHGLDNNSLGSSNMVSSLSSRQSKSSSVGVTFIRLLLTGTALSQDKGNVLEG